MEGPSEAASSATDAAEIAGQFALPEDHRGV